MASNNNTNSTSPVPPSPIKGQCTVIHDNTLYVYSPDSFLSLDLKANATWNTLPQGVSVTGGVCVKGLDSGPNSDPALWVVGGAANQSNADFPGLQRFSFNNQTWAAVTPISTITKNRRNHGAAFLNQTGQILVYAGSQDDPDTPSIETFLIQTTSPFNVISASGHNTPVTAPVLLPWDATSAIAIGGAEHDTNIYQFKFDAQKQMGAWQTYNTSLPAPLKNANQEQANIVQGSDGSKVLEIYDCSVTPNAVTRYVLQDANGNPVPTGTQIGQGSSPNKRDVSLANWPTYNGTAAPTFTRNGFSLSTGQNGLVTMTGGNDDNAVSLFDGQKNSWVDSSRFFNVDTQQPLIPTPTPVPTQTGVPTATASAAANAGNNSHKTGVILGAVLGTILGVIILCVIALVWFRYRQQKRRRELAAQAEEEKRRMSFADRGDPLMMEGGGAGGGEKPFNHVPYPPGAGRGVQTHHRNTSTRGSDSSTARLVPRKPVNAPYTDTMEMDNMGDKGANSERSPRASSVYPTTPKRSSGWSRYFSGNKSTDGGRSNSSLHRKSSNKSRGRYSEDGHSTFTMDSSHIIPPAELPPLRLGQQFSTERISRVVTGSTPPTSPPNGSLRQVSGGHSLYSNTDRPRTTSSALSATSTAPSLPEDSLFSRQSASHDNSPWTMSSVRGELNVPKLRDNVPSSVYSRDSNLPTSAAPPPMMLGQLNPISERSSLGTSDILMPSTSQNRVSTGAASATATAAAAAAAAGSSAIPTRQQSAKVVHPDDESDSPVAAEPQSAEIFGSDSRPVSLGAFTTPLAPNSTREPSRDLSSWGSGPGPEPSTYSLDMSAPMAAPSAKPNTSVLSAQTYGPPGRSETSAPAYGQIARSDMPVSAVGQSTRSDVPVPGSGQSASTQSGRSDEPSRSYDLPDRSHDSMSSSYAPAGRSEVPIPPYGPSARFDGPSTFQGPSARYDGSSTSQGQSARSDGPSTSYGQSARSDAPTSSFGQSTRPDVSAPSYGQSTRSENSAPSYGQNNAASKNPYNNGTAAAVTQGMRGNAFAAMPASASARQPPARSDAPTPPNAYGAPSTFGAPGTFGAPNTYGSGRDSPSERSRPRIRTDGPPPLTIGANSRTASPAGSSRPFFNDDFVPSSPRTFNPAAAYAPPREPVAGFPVPSQRSYSPTTYGSRPSPPPLHDPPSLADSGVPRSYSPGPYGRSASGPGGRPYSPVSNQRSFSPSGQRPYSPVSRPGDGPAPPGGRARAGSTAVQGQRTFSPMGAANNSVLPPRQQFQEPMTLPSPRGLVTPSVDTSRSSDPSFMDDHSKSARVSDPDTWPRPPSMGNAPKPVDVMPPVPSGKAEHDDDDDDDDEDFDYDEDPHIEVVTAKATPTAKTAIPVPGSTAMQYTVNKKAPNTDMSWVNLSANN